jgi:putative ATPase
MADPNAICVAVACSEAVERIGLPEARIILAEAAVYVATAPKSNASYMGIEAALSKVRESHIGDVPNHLKDAHYKGASKLGHGDGYLYAHNYPEHYVKQQYLPDELVGTTFYEPTDIGYEEKVKERLDRLKNR